MHDTVELERRGVPTALVLTRGFVEEGRAAAGALGRPDLPFAAITHPLSTLGEAEVRGRAREAFVEIVAVLTGGETA